MRRLFFKISLFEILKCEYYFYIGILKIQLREWQPPFWTLGFKKNESHIYIHLLGIPIIIPLKSKVR